MPVPYGRGAVGMGGRGPQPLRKDDPREVAGYTLRARIGEGGMGTVFLTRGRDGASPLVALKRIRPEHARSEKFRRRFAREVAAARRGSGPHLVQVVDHDAEADLPWLATRYVPGLPLCDALAEHGPLPPECVLMLTAGAARALDAVHTAGFVHRDVKEPAAVRGRAVAPRLRHRARDGRHVRPHDRRADGRHTEVHVSEHALGRRVTPASDVFTLGLVAAEAATGRHPYGEGGGLVVATRIAGTDREPPDLSAHPPALRRLLAATLAARPEDRPTAAEVAALCGAGAGFAAAGRLPKRVASAVTAIDRASAKIFPDARDPRTGWLDRLRGDT